MEFFNKAKAVRLRSHLGKYLIANDDEETVRQSHKGFSPEGCWTVEFVAGNCHLIRLKSYYDKYLTASDEPFLLGMTGKKILQTTPSSKMEGCIEWEPITAGFHVKLRTRNGKFLRANGGTPPWRNSLTHDVPHRTATQDWVLWAVDVVDIVDFYSLSSSDSCASSLSSYSFSSFSQDFTDSDTGSPLVSSASSFGHLSARQCAMEIFQKAKVVRLRSHHDKYLLADEDEENVCQDRNGSCLSARWNVEIVQDSNLLRLKSCYGKYLTASGTPFFLGVTGKKVLQTLPRRLDSSLEWEPIKDGIQVKLKTRIGDYLRANGGVPPWRNSITHDIPHRSSTQDWILWDVDIVEFHKPAPSPPRPEPQQVKVAEKTPPPSPPQAINSVEKTPPAPQPHPQQHPQPQPQPNPRPQPHPHPQPQQQSHPHPQPQPHPHPHPHQHPNAHAHPQPPQKPIKVAETTPSQTPSGPSSPTSINLKSPKYEADDFSFPSSPVKDEGRLIVYGVANDNGDVDESRGELSFTFKGSGVEQLKEALKKETGLDDIIVCSRNRLNGKLYPLRLQLPPNNATLNVVLVPSSSEVARDLK